MSYVKHSELPCRWGAIQINLPCLDSHTVLSILLNPLAFHWCLGQFGIYTICCGHVWYEDNCDYGFVIKARSVLYSKALLFFCATVCFLFTSCGTFMDIIYYHNIMLECYGCCISLKCSCVINSSFKTMQQLYGDLLHSIYTYTNFHLFSWMNSGSSDLK